MTWGRTPVLSTTDKPGGEDSGLTVGLISDTHGLLRPEVFTAFEGVAAILHAGDVGDPDILTALGVVAPVTAVWGNTDGFDLRRILPEVAELTLAGVLVRIVHGHQVGSPSGAAIQRQFGDAGLTVFGHSHTPEIARVSGGLAVNPGSAGPRRFKLPVTVAIARMGQAGVTVEIVDLTRLTG